MSMKVLPAAARATLVHPAAALLPMQLAQLPTVARRASLSMELAKNLLLDERGDQILLGALVDLLEAHAPVGLLYARFGTKLTMPDILDEGLATGCGFFLRPQSRESLPLFRKRKVAFDAWSAAVSRLHDPLAHRGYASPFFHSLTS